MTEKVENKEVAPKPKKSLGRKIFNYTWKILLGIVILIVLLIFSLRIPAVQNFVKNRLITYLEGKIHTKVSLEKVYINFPNSIEMRQLYLKGQDVDTLLYVKSFDAGLNIPDLLSNKASINSIDLEGTRANVVRNEKGDFNFDYIMKAFASDKKDETPSKPWVIALDKIKLKDVGINFIDKQSSNSTNVYFKSFDTSIKTFDLDKNTYAINDINMDGLRLKLKQDLVKEVAKKVEKKVDSLKQQAPLQIGLKGINLTNFNIDYGDDNSKTYAKVIFGELSTKINKIDLEKSIYDVDQASLKDADINANLFLASQNNKPAETSTVKDQANPMQVLLGKLNLDNVKVAYNNTAAKATAQGMDFNHLNFSKMNVDLRDFKMQDGTFAGSVKSAEIKENRGLDIQKFNTNFVYGKNQAFLKDLYLQTPKTVLRDEVIIDYKSIEQLSHNLGDVGISANLAKSKLGLSDVLMLVPSLRNTAPFNKYPNAILNINANVNGKVNDLTIKNFEFSGIDKTVVKASGRIKNGMDPNNLWFDLKVPQLVTSAHTILNLVPKGTIPSNIAIPKEMLLNGVAKGTTKDVNADLHLKTSLGNADVLAKVDMRRKNAERYDINAKLHQVQVGRIIQNKEVGSITGNIVAKGVGFDPKTLNANVTGFVNSAQYKGYTYQNMNLKGSMNHGAYAVNLNSKDPNANLALNAAGVYNKTNPTVKFDGSIVKLDLQKLGFYDKPMIIAGDLLGDFQNLDPDHLNGSLNLSRFAMSDTKSVLPIQDVSLKAVSTADRNQLTLNSQVVDLDLQGKYKLTQIAGALMETVDQYYHIQQAGKKPKIDPHQYFTFTGKVKNDQLIQRFVPDLTDFETINLEGSFNADQKQLVVNGKIPQLTYGSNNITNGIVDIKTADGKLLYDLTVGELKSSSIDLKKIAVNGDIANNIINYNVSTKDDQDKTQFLIAGNAKSMGDVMQVALNENGLKLNYDDWQVAPDNYIQIAPKGLVAHNFVLSQGSSQIALESESTAPNSPLNVKINNFKIESITAMLKKDSLLAKGTINGTAQVRDLKNNMTLNTDILVDHLEAFGNPIGDLSVKVKNSTPKLLDANIGLTGNDNDVQITGTYNTAQSSFDLDMLINKLQMKSVQGFSMNNIVNAEGFVSGKMKITGTADQPKILGQVKFNQAGMTIAKTGSRFKDLNDAIDFTSEGIAFNKFQLKDPDGNALTINGKILTTTYRDFAFALRVRATDFKVVDSKADQNQMMYGTLAINANLNIGGDLTLPKVDGTLAVTDKTDFTFVLPQSSPQLQDRDGIVEFIDQDQIALNKTIKKDSITAQNKVKGMDVNVNIDINKEAKISLLIDKANGDFVKIQGQGQLTGGIDPSGKTTLVGVYQVEKGAYEMSVSVLKRKFDIQKGSTITWNGDPMSATLNITAVYKANASPIDLVEQQITGLSSSQMNMYKQKIPFNTLLILKGELMKPDISFDITTDEKNASVSTDVLQTTQSKLAMLRTDPSEMNKQVFALLLLNRFVGENPFQSNSGVSAETMAKQSVSKLLSQQLNNLAADLIKGVDLNFDLENTEDYSTGARNDRTDLNVDISKTLLNDRLKVTVGSNFGIDGQARQNEQMTNIAGDVSLDYALSKDGKYTLRVYRKNEYQVALQGQVVETGVGFIITVDYDQFKEIFQRRKENKAYRQQRKQDINQNTKANK